MRKITPNLWFNGNAEEAMRFYLSVFKDSEELGIVRYTEVGPGEPGTPVTVHFRILDMEIVGINAGPEVSFSEAFSLEIRCEDQAEVDYYWNALTADGGEESMCGWCKDKFGFSWQVVPQRLVDLLGDPDVANEVTQAMFTMRKLDIAALDQAAERAKVS